MRISMMAMALSGVLAACSSSSPPVAKSGETKRAVVTQEAPADSCRAAQRAELEAWIDEMVTNADDELEMWTALGMIMTLTSPEELAEMRETMPEAATALDKSTAAYEACKDIVAVNCAALDRALDVTETRVGESVWDRGSVADQCMSGKVDAEAADCALAATDVETAKGCFAG